ncbi:MarR family transcriptional regulator [Streptomyces sp. NPDC047049]|uniref:MarR family transcriptional regulator n=1 Tax=Streptomyces sp. NPDC047049 TaxID=3156688 RepID=UPI0033C4D0D2
MTVPAHEFDPESLGTPPLYTLNLSAAQRDVLAWLEEHGAFVQAIGVDAAQVASDCGISESTAYEAFNRLTGLRLALDIAPATYRLNARYFFTAHPEMRTMVSAALHDPAVKPDERALAPRKRGNTDARRRRTIRPVDTD